MPYGPGGFNHGGGYTQRLAWGGAGRREEMPISREVAALSKEQHDREAKYAGSLQKLENTVRKLVDGYWKENDIDPRAVQEAVNGTTFLLAQAEVAAELRRLVEKLSK